MRTYDETIAYLYSQLPVFHRIGAKAFKGDLSNTLKLCEALGNPQHSFKSIHVAGTNGKGSTSHYLAAILQSAGYNVGLYTSPHLKDYTERFRFNGKAIEKSAVVKFVEENQAILEEIKPSFFEMSVALAFDYFAKLSKTGENSLDIAIIEVGLGGRLDSTNVISPLLSVITNIGFDHTDILGNTLEKIAFEKAGIIKPKVPVVISEARTETKEVFREMANLKQAPIYFAQENFELIYKGNTSEGILFDAYKARKKIISEGVSALGGQYQLRNLVGIFQSVDILREQGYIISEKSLLDGLKNVISLTSLKGRWQVLGENPLTICDTAHNEHGLKEVLKHISTLIFSKKYFILSFVADKNVDELLELFPKDGFYYISEIHSPRAMPAEILLNKCKSHGLRVELILNVNEAIDFVRKNAEPRDLVYVGGSTYLVAEIENL